LLTPVNLNPDQKYVCGYIYDRDTKNPVAYATIYNRSKTKVKETDNLGYFKFDVSKEDRTIFVSYLGYNPIELN